jgi:hypothetical protein
LAKKVIAVLILILLIILLALSRVQAHDLPSNDPSDYIRPYEPVVVKLAKKVGRQPFSKYLLDNTRIAYYWVAWNIRYMYDHVRWGEEDYWQLPSTTIMLGTGDCEDKAILLTSLLRALGIPRENVHMVFGRIEWLWGGYVGGHAWLEIKLPKNIAQAFQELALETLTVLENTTLVIPLEKGLLYVNITKDIIKSVIMLGWGDRDGWIPFDPTLILLPLPGGRAVPIPFSLWLWLGYYVYYLVGVRAIPESFYVDKPWTYDTTIILPPNNISSINIPCNRSEYLYGYVKASSPIITLTATSITNTSKIIDIAGEIRDPDGNVITSFSLTDNNTEFSFGFITGRDGIYELILKNNAKFDVWITIHLSKESLAVQTLYNVVVEEYVVLSELEYLAYIQNVSKNMSTIITLAIPTTSPLATPITVTVMTTVTTTYTTTQTVVVPTVVTTTYITTTTIPTTYTTTIRVYETATATTTVVKYETVTTTSVTTVPIEKTVEKTTTLTVTTPTTVYERVVDWSTTIPIAVILLVIGIAIGYLIKRR